MSGLILCRTKEAENPYYISGMDLNIYSLEELCYYIYNNVYLIGLELADETLFEFIRNETGETELADRLKVLKKQKAGLAEIVVTILKYVDYYTIGEIEQIREIIETLNTQNVLERLKARADSFLDNKCYYSAISNYNNIISSKKDSTLPGIFYARVYHNTGVAYARLFLYERAIECFDRAYCIGQHEESKRCSFAASIMLADSKTETNISYDEEDAEDEDLYVMKREIETLMDNAVYSPECKELEYIQNLKNEGNVSEHYKAIDELLRKWKKQYNKYTT